MNAAVFELVDFIKACDGNADKAVLASNVQQEFKLILDRSVYYCEYFAIRFSSTKSLSFSNTVVSLSKLQKFDELPFLVCQVTSSENIIYLANTTFLRKVSHSSQDLRIDNIRGSVNGSDIMREFNGIVNEPRNFKELFNIHAELGFSENLPRLVEATNNISPSGSKFDITADNAVNIDQAPDRAVRFVRSNEYLQLKLDLDERVRRVRGEIVIAGCIENRNIRGRIIEYLIAGEDLNLRERLIEGLVNDTRLPKFSTTNALADYTREFNLYETATDVKTKLMVLNSNPKAYNIDKLLEYLSKERSVFLFYFIGIEPDRIVNQVLVSMFQVELLRSTILLKHWAGRNSRGVTQFKGSALNELILSPNNHIDIDESKRFLQNLIKL